MASRPLEGIRVLDLSRLLPGPFLTMVLGDMGADVVKVEAPNIGDYMRQMPPLFGAMAGRFLAVNRNKRSLVLDLKAESGRDALLRMAAKADVVVETFRPGVLDRLGVGYAALTERNPGIILCSISGYGQTGPFRDRAGHDLNYLAMAGVLGLSAARRGDKPAMPGAQVADLAGGALWGATGVLGALVGRGRTGIGQHLDIAMCEGSLALLAHEFGAGQAAGEYAQRCEAPLNGGLACYSVYEAKDGGFLSVAALEPKFWLALNAALGRKGDMSEVAAGPDRQEEIRQELQAIFSTKTRDEWAEVLSTADCCVEPVLTLDEVADQQLHRERGMFFELDGAIQVRTPVADARADLPAPALGQHSAEVLAEYGFDDDEIAALTS